MGADGGGCSLIPHVVLCDEEQLKVFPGLLGGGHGVPAAADVIEITVVKIRL